MVAERMVVKGIVVDGPMVEKMSMDGTSVRRMLVEYFCEEFLRTEC